MLGKRLINTKVAGGGGCTDIVDNYDPFGGNGVALYQLNGDATDVSGSHNGTWGGTESYTTGVFGQAAFFNGSSYVNLNGSVISVGSFGISLWVNWYDVDDQTRAFHLGDSDNNSNVSIFVSSGIGNVRFKDSGGNNRDITFPASANQWYHIALTYEISNNNYKVYLNGAQIGSTIIATGFTNLANYGGIGAYMYSSGALFRMKGSVDQVRIFNTALTPLEVEALYTEELCICDGTVDTLDILGDGSCIATYQLDGNANDLSGNYSGTPTDVSYGVGEFDLAGVFNGSSSYISGLPTLTNVSTAFTVSLWLHYTTNPSSGSKYVFGGIKEQGAEDSLVGIFVNNLGNIGYITRGSNSDTLHQIITSEDFTNGWHNVVITSDSTSMSLYVDGSNINTLSVSPTITVDNSVLGAINSRGTIEEYFPCSIDQVRIFNKALSAGEVTTLYNETACTKAACTGTTNTLDILGDGSCIATYTLDGSPADLSGNYNGVQTDVTYPQGYFDLAGSFNGSSSYIDTSISTLSSTFSVSMWINEVSLGSGGFFGNWNATANDDMFWRTQPDGSLRINFDGAANQYFGSAGDITANNWHHIVVTFNNGTINVYADGNNKGSTITINTTFNSGANFYIGDDNSATFFNGSIDQVRIFNKALSASEVTTLYNETPCN